MMKALHLRTRACRRKRSSANPTTTLAIYCYAAAILIISSHHDYDSNGGGRIIYLPGVKSFQYDDKRYFMSCCSRSLVLSVRGGGEESDGISDGNEIISSQLTSALRTDTSTTSSSAALDGFGTFVNTGESCSSPSRGLWKRIKIIGGGVDDKENDIEDDDLDEVEGSDDEHESTTRLTNKSNETRTTSEAVVLTSEGTSNCSSNIASDDGENNDDGNIPNQSYQWMKEGGVLSSFFSLFRASDESDDTIGMTTAAVTSVTGIAHKMKIPHGPDGRGGGGAVAAAMPPPTTTTTTVTKNSQEQDTESDFLISTEVNEVATNARDSGEVELSSSVSMTSEAETKPAVGTGGDVAAFVVPPPHHKPAPSDDTDKAKKPKKRKSSKIKTRIDEIQAEETKAVNASLTNTQNETDAIAALNDTLDSNTTGLHSSISNETDDVMEMIPTKDYTSTGYWIGIDLIASLGLSHLNDDLKVSRALRPVRKAAAKATGLHGFFSGKQYITTAAMERASARRNATTVISIDEELGIHDADALEAEMLARRVALRKRRRGRDKGGSGIRFGRRWGFRRGNSQQAMNANANNIVSDYVVVPGLDPSPDALEHRRRERVEEIDRLLHRGSERLLELQCERDDLLCAPNPLYNYTKAGDPSTNRTFGDVRTTREFNFPSPELVDEYIGELVSNGRLVSLNHTDLWLSRSDTGMDDDEIVGDDLLTPSADARKLYENLDELEPGMSRNGNKNKGGGGSWLLRTGFGRNGGSLGEKLGETIEIGAYKGVCSSVMMVLARMLSGLHGVNILSYSDIRTYIEQDPDLPPVDKKHGPLLGGDKNNYAQEAIKTAIQKGAKKKRKTKHGSSHRSSSRRHSHDLSDDAFIQRDAVVETLISHCQISAPLLKLFPLDWQRAMVGNIITLATAIISDFADGLQVQMLGHALTVSFKPITEADMIQHIGAGGFRQNHRRTRPDEFEAAVLATAQDLSESLSFLDGWLEWFERKVGGGVLRSQIGNLIARVVLTLVDEVLSGARLDLWSSQANGPRLVPVLEYRTSSIEEQLNE